MTKEFQWTTELVTECFQYWRTNPLSKEETIAAFIASKQPKPSFTTADGVDIFLHDSFYYVGKKFYIVKDYAKPNVPYNLLRAFYTKEHAEQYVIDNKPCLSLNDLKESWKQVYASGSSLTELKFYSQITNLIKSRL